VPDDSGQPLKHLGVDLCCVYALVRTSCWFYKINCSSLHVMNTVKTIILSENDISCAQTWSCGWAEFNCYFPGPSRLLYKTLLWATYVVCVCCGNSNSLV